MLADRDIQPAGLDQVQVDRQAAERRHPAGCRLGFVLERQRTLCHASVTPLVMALCFATTAYLLDSSRPTGNLIILDPDLRKSDRTDQTASGQPPFNQGVASTDTLPYVAGTRAREGRLRSPWQNWMALPLS